MKHKWFHKPAAALCALILLLSLVPTAYAAGDPAKSKNINAQDYTTYGSTVRSYLYDNGNGLTRVEYTGSQIVVEDYDSAFNLTNSRTLTMELPLWGGFFAGADANYVIFGQNNPGESASTEVIRVVKYSKDWRKQGSTSIKGAYTKEPFDGGSLRCAEYGGYLYIHASRTMFRNALNGIYNVTFDTLANHQANLTLEIRESDMALVDSFDAVGNLDFGYVSHSFNQFILIDQDKNIVTLDHSDSNSDANGRANYGYAQKVTSRGVDLIRYDEKAGQDHFRGKAANQRYQWADFSLVQGFAGSSGNNTTGASVGGFAETASGYVSAFNYDGKGSTGARDVYLGYTTKSGLKSSAKKISTASGTTTPQLVSTGLGGGYILWNGKSGNNANDTLYYASYSDSGAVGTVKTAAAPLSDCQPISYNGKVVWYVTNNSAPTFYGLDEGGVTVLGGAAPSEQTPSDTTPPAEATKPTETTKPADTAKPTDTTAPAETTAPTETTKPTDTAVSPVEASFEAHNIDPNSPRYGDIIGGKSGCNHNFGTSWRWYWPGTPGTTTCTENAYSYSTCSICGAKQVNGFMFAPGHKFVNGVCTVCGESESGKAPDETDTGSGTPSTTPLKLTADAMLAAPTFDWNTALKADGTVWTWNNVDRTPQQKSGLKAKSASADSCTGEDGSLWIWGYQAYIDGSSNTNQTSTPAKVMDNVLYAGINDSGYAIALKTDGTLWRWGAGKAPGNAVKVLDNVVQAQNPGPGWYALKKDGTLWHGSGYDDSEQIGAGYVAFSAVDGGNTIYGIKVDGSLWGWGKNDTAQLGQGYASQQIDTPVKILDDVAVVEGSYAVTTDGTLYVWGWNNQGQLGFSGGDIQGVDFGKSVCQGKPRKVLDGVVMVRERLALKSDGTLWRAENGSFQKVLDGVKLPDVVSSTASSAPTTTPTDTTAKPTTPTTPTTAKNPFTDVPANAYYTDAVIWALEKGVTTGATATTFEPNSTCTRAQVATFLWRAKGSPEPATKTNPFRDVKSSDYYYKAVLWAYENGITTGATTTTFDPNGTCTNGHVVTFLWRAEGKPKASGTSALANSFRTDFYTDAVAWADTTGLLSNTGAAFNPASQSPRSNIVTYLYRDLAE